MILVVSHTKFSLQFFHKFQWNNEPSGLHHDIDPKFLQVECVTLNIYLFFLLKETFFGLLVR